MRQDPLASVARFAVTLISSFIATMKTGVPTATTVPGWMTLTAQDYSREEVVMKSTTTTKWNIIIVSLLKVTTVWSRTCTTSRQNTRNCQWFKAIFM